MAREERLKHIDVKQTMLKVWHQSLWIIFGGEYSYEADSLTYWYQDIYLLQSNIRVTRITHFKCEEVENLEFEPLISGKLLQLDKFDILVAKIW